MKRREKKQKTLALTTSSGFHFTGFVKDGILQICEVPRDAYVLYLPYQSLGTMVFSKYAQLLFSSHTFW